MPINGFTKTTLLDYPGKIAAVLFLDGCNFRCPYCHNSGLVLSPDSQARIPQEQVLHVLKKRKNILEGVCITGGEPTLDKNLIPLISRIKDLGYAAKLDTNGSNPRILKELVSRQLVDAVTMDIKSSQENGSPKARRTFCSPTKRLRRFYSLASAVIPQRNWNIFAIFFQFPFHLSESGVSIKRYQ